MIYRVHAQGPGIGDAMWLTALARNLKLQRPEDDIVPITAHPEIFRDNSDIVNAVLFSGEAVNRAKDIRLTFNPPIHAIDGYCLQLGLKPPFIRRNFIYLDKWEIIKAVRLIHPALKVIAVQSQAGPWTRNKDWNFRYFEEVIDYFKGKHYRMVQIGAKGDKKLKGCCDFFGTVRETAAVMSRCMLFIGPVSAGMHLASAIGLPSIIIFGGREDPKAIALEGHVALFTKLDCSPCWKVENCPDRKCMMAIKPNKVIECAEKILN